MIPIDRRKRPLIAWKQYQTKVPTKAEQENWKKKFGNKIAGWAIPTGVASGIIALDFDGEIGIQTLDELALKPNVQTPSGAYHVWLASPGFPVKTGAMDDRWPGMELKGDGGYVITEGRNIESNHGNNSITGDYLVLNEEPTSIDELDSDLAEWITDKPTKAKPDKQPKAETGSRNKTGFLLAKELRDLGHSKEDVFDTLLEEYLPQVDQEGHPYTEEELRKTVDSVFTKKGRASSRDQILNLILSDEDIDVWTDGKDGYLSLGNNNNVRIRSKKCKELISSRFFKANKKSVPKSAVDEAVDTLDALAKESGDKYETRIRIGWHGGECYYDTGETVYKIGADLVEPISDSPVKFLRNDMLGKMPDPKYGKDGWYLLRKYINVEEVDWPLVKASILAAFMPAGSYPIVAFTGSHASGKSTSVSAMVMITDARHSVESCRDTMPRDKRNLAVAARYNHILAFDNESHISKDISDALAMLSTGGQLKTRMLYTDDEIATFTTRKLVYVNSIGDIVTESDLLDRSVIIECPPLESYRSESDMWTEYECDRPYILGTIFESVQRGISNLHNISGSRPDRLVDFIRWTIACGVEGFEASYAANRLKAPFIAINNSYIGALIMRLIRTTPTERRKQANREAAKILSSPALAEWDWVGSFSMLHELGSVESGEWYRSVMGAVNAYKRVKSDLLKVGVQIQEFQHLHQTWIAIRGTEREREEN